MFEIVVHNLDTYETKFEMFDTQAEAEAAIEEYNSDCDLFAEMYYEYSKPERIPEDMKEEAISWFSHVLDSAKANNNLKMEENVHFAEMQLIYAEKGYYIW